jgi:hypothetical protein
MVLDDGSRRSLSNPQPNSDWTKPIVDNGALALGPSRYSVQFNAWFSLLRNPGTTCAGSILVATLTTLAAHFFIFHK